MDFIGSKFEQLDVKSVSSEKLKRGERYYSNWAVQNYRWYPKDYDHRGFRAVYSERLFETRARLVSEVLEYCDSQELLPNLLGKDLKVVSFGCGPGNDLLGFEDFYKKKKNNRIKELKKRVRRQKESLPNKPGLIKSIKCNESLIEDLKSRKVTYTGYDTSCGWEEYVCGLGYHFQTRRVDKKFVDTMRPVDVAILCYFSHSAKLQWYTRYNTSFWESLTEKCEVILVMDTVFESEDFDEMLSEVGFTELEEEFEDDEDRDVYTTIWSTEN